MCTINLALSKEDSELSAGSKASQSLLKHVDHCLECLFIIAKQREPLLDAGCSKFQKLFAAAHPLFDYSKSPLGTLHVSQDIIEEYHFGRLSVLEQKVFEAHVSLCSECANELHNHRMFIYCLQTALSPQKPFDRDRNGATFAASSAA